MEQADEAGENRRANVSVHLAMQDEVYRYSLLLHGDLFSVKGVERVDGLKPSRFAWRCALLQCTPLSVGSCAIRYLWRYGKIRRCGKPAARPRGYAPDTEHLFRGVGGPGFPIRPRPACQSAGTSLLRRITGKLQGDHRGAIVPMARDSVVWVSNSRTWWPVSSNETAVLTG